MIKYSYKKPRRRLALPWTENMLEDWHAKLFAQWLHSNGYKFHHSPNEKGTGNHYAMLAQMKKKRLGMSKGFPDYIIILKRWSLLFIELKKERWKRWWLNGSTISPEQEEWIQDLHRLNNVGAFFAHGVEEAKEIVRREEKL